MAGRIWPAGYSLETPGLENKSLGNEGFFRGGVARFSGII